MVTLHRKVADFTAASTGGPFKLHDQRGHAVVLYFYPKDNTPGCTTEGAQFRDLAKDFQKEIAKVLQQLEGLSAAEAQNQVYRLFEFDLCPACQRDYIRKPLRSID